MVCSAVLEVGLNHPLLREGVQVVVAPSDTPGCSPLAFLDPLLPEVLPIVVYAISRDNLSDQVSGTGRCWGRGQVEGGRCRTWRYTGVEGG